MNMRITSAILVTLIIISAGVVEAKGPKPPAGATSRFISYDQWTQTIVIEDVATSQRTVIEQWTPWEPYWYVTHNGYAYRMVPTSLTTNTRTILVDTNADGTLETSVKRGGYFTLSDDPVNIYPLCPIPWNYCVPDS